MLRNQPLPFSTRLTCSPLLHFGEPTCPLVQPPLLFVADVQAVGEFHGEIGFGGFVIQKWEFT